MNQLEQFREQCAKAGRDFIAQESDNECLAVGVMEYIDSLPLPKVEQKPIAYMRHRFAQSLETNGYCDGHEWLEVCNEGEKGDDKTLAFPVYDVPPDAEALRKENENLREALKEIHSWIVCGCIATPEDMAANFPNIEKLCADVLGIK